MTPSATIKGIFCPNIVPFTQEGKINEDELRRIVEWLIGKGVHGIYPNGSTGEFARLSFEERMRVVTVIAEQTRGRVPILAGGAENSIDLVVEASRRYADLGVSAMSVTGPYFYHVSPEGVEEYFREVARRTEIDILVYNIPQFSNEIGIESLVRLASDCPRIIGTKDSSRDFPRFLHSLNRIRPLRSDFIFLIGCEEILYPALLMGADGGTIASSGVVPEPIVGIYNDFLAGRHTECRATQFKILNLIEAMIKAGNFPEGFRSGMTMRGFNPGPSRQPMGEHDREQLQTMEARIAGLLHECGFYESAIEAKPLP
jgi:4-hydroxy-tetrahydrodipicolinate synthase